MSEKLFIDEDAQDASEATGRKAVEVWAEAKGMWPQFQAPAPLALPQGTQAGPFGTVPVDLRAEFDAAIATASGQVAR
jgi:hypothetical protein